MITIFYDFAIQRVSRYISSDKNMTSVRRGDGSGMDAFRASEILAVIFDKPLEQIVKDIVDFHVEKR